ncbi:MAG: polyprenyl synthetase family protein [Acidimicrobiales bacterium]
MDTDAARAPSEAVGAAPSTGGGPSAGAAPHADAEVTAMVAGVDHVLSDLLDQERERWVRIDPTLKLGFDLLIDLVARGTERLQPRWCLLAFLGTGGDPHDDQAVRLAAALELFHTAGLIHDDVIDGSDSRRHGPSLHRALADTHERQRWRVERRRFSEGVAVLLGNLALGYADRLLRGMPPAVHDVFDELRPEAHLGQYLDVMVAAIGEGSAARTRRIVRYKAAACAVERPLHLGAALTGHLSLQGDGLSRFALTVGEAFQLRDDLLGVFGDPVATGKPQGDDLREGKQTWLVHLTRSWAAQRRDAVALALLGRIGRTELALADAAAIRSLMIESGAVDTVEARIAECLEEAVAALDQLDLSPAATVSLADLARRCAADDAADSGKRAV